MKKVILLFAAFVMFSCSTEETAEVPTQKEASAEVLFTNDLAKTTNPVGKSVQRGLIPVTVDLINIHARKSGETLFMDFPFELVANGTADADTKFVLKNLPVGNVEFAVFTNGGLGSGSVAFNYGANGALFYGQRMVVAETGTLQDVFKKYSTIKPGIVFSATATKPIIAGINPSVEFSLKPQNGRIISIYTLSQDLKNFNYTAKIEAYSSPNAILTKDNLVVRYEGTKACWSNNGDIANETVTIYNENGEQVAVFIVKPVIVNGESTNAIYTITADKVPACTLLSPTIFVPEFINELPQNKTS